MSMNAVKRGLVGAAVCGLASLASAQTASVQLVPSSSTVAPGGTVTVSVQVNYDVAGADSGTFGPSGLYGGGGDVVGTGTGATITSAAVETDFGSLLAPGMLTGNNIDRIGGGRGLLSATTGGSDVLFSFEVNVASGAAGTLIYDYDGAVLLVVGDSIQTFSTNPGIGQSSLSTTPASITITQGGCNRADLAAPFGVLNFADVQSFLGSFGAGLPAADLAAPAGVFNFADVQTFLGLFGTGC